MDRQTILHNQARRSVEEALAKFPKTPNGLSRLKEKDPNRFVQYNRLTAQLARINSVREPT